VDPISASIFTLAGSVVLLSLIYVFKGPKEMDREMSDRVGALSERQDESEEQHHVLDKELVRVSSELRHLSNTIDRLILTLDRAGITSGEHRALKPRRGE
jgi:hypothetical protein